MTNEPIIKTSPRERETKIKRIKDKLEEIKAYKKILAEEGLSPDADDKFRESELIVQLLRLEKGLDAKIPPAHKRKKLQIKEARKLEKRKSDGLNVVEPSPKPDLRGRKGKDED